MKQVENVLTLLLSRRKGILIPGLYISSSFPGLGTCCINYTLTSQTQTFRITPPNTPTHTQTLIHYTQLTYKNKRNTALSLQCFLLEKPSLSYSPSLSNLLIEQYTGAAFYPPTKHIFLNHLPYEFWLYHSIKVMLPNIPKWCPKSPAFFHCLPGGLTSHFCHISPSDFYAVPSSWLLFFHVQAFPKLLYIFFSNISPLAISFVSKTWAMLCGSSKCIPPTNSTLQNQITVSVLLIRHVHLTSLSHYHLKSANM